MWVQNNMSCIKRADLFRCVGRFLRDSDGLIEADRVYGVPAHGCNAVLGAKVVD